MNEVPQSHPRYLSLKMRESIVEGVEKGVTSIHGLIAHGRGEAFDYLIGEQTRDFARKALGAAAAMLRLARHPVLSVNGNVAALVGAPMVALGRALNAPLEVNIFHTSKKRECLIADHLRAFGAEWVLLPDARAQLDYIDSNRRFVHPDGLLRADVVFVPLEDGDRCQALRQMGKEVVTVDLNPLSRTAQRASVTVVDHVARALPVLIEAVEQAAGRRPAELEARLAAYDNSAVLKAAEACVRGEGK